MVTAKDRILKPHIVKYNENSLGPRRLVKFREKRPKLIVGIKTYVRPSITSDWHIRYQLRAEEFCKNRIFTMSSENLDHKKIDWESILQIVYI